MFRPCSFNLFATYAAHAGHQMKRVFIMALFFVGAEMILRYRPAQLSRSARELDLEMRGELRDAL